MNPGAPAARPTTGLVLEVTPDKIMVLTREGIFLEVPRRDLTGDVVAGAVVPVELGAQWFAQEAGHTPAAVEAPAAVETLPAVEVGASPRGRLSSLWRSWYEAARRRRPAVRALGAAAAVVVLLGLGFGLYRQNTAVYQVALEINPAILLEINAYDRVVRSRAANADGEAVLRVMDPRGMTVAEAVRALVATLKDMGFLPATAPEPLSSEPVLAGFAAVTPTDGAGDSSDGGTQPAEEAAGPAVAGRSEPAAGSELGPAAASAEVDAPGPTLAISIIAPSRTRTANGAAVAQVVENSLLDAASETGTVFDAVVQVVSADEVARVRQKGGDGGSIAKAVLAEKARSRGVELSDDEITRVSVPDLARMVGERRSAGDDDQDKYEIHIFRVTPRGDAGDDDRRGGSAQGIGDRDRRRGGDDDGQARGPGRAGGRGDAGRSWGAGGDDDSGRRGGQAGGRSDRGFGGDDDDRGRRGNFIGRGSRDDRDRDHDRFDDHRSSWNQGDDDRRFDRGNARGRGGDDDDDRGSGRGRGRSRDDDRRGQGRGQDRGGRGGDDSGRERFNRFFNRLPLFNGLRNR